MGRLNRHVPAKFLKPPKGFKKPDPKKFKADMQNLGEAIAEEFKNTIIDNIKSNRYKYRLAPSTLEKKQKAGASLLPFIETGEYLDSIVREGTTITVEDTKRTDSNLTNLEIAMVLEYGRKDKSIPARPLWRNSFLDFKERALQMRNDFFKNGKV